MLLNRPFLEKTARQSDMDVFRNQEHVLFENKQIFFKKNSFDIFLSHSYLDKSLVYTIVDLFNDAGYSVYVDWMVDQQLDRSKINANTAEKLRGRMDESLGLAYIATSNISNSKWCPWELGYVDGKKSGRCAILPVLAIETTEFKGQEYLGLYPYIDYEIIKGSDRYEFWVNDPSERNKYIKLKDWLQGKKLEVHE